MSPLRAAVSNESVRSQLFMRGAGEMNQLVWGTRGGVWRQAQRMNESVPVVTLREVWAHAQRPVHVLVIDIEGAEEVCSALLRRSEHRVPPHHVAD